MDTLNPSLSLSLSFNKLRPLPCNFNLHFNKYLLHRRKKPNGRRIRNGALLCRAEFSEDAPLAVAIGACILNSLAFPIPSGPDDGDDQEQGGSVIDSTDARFAVMGIISFIPYFNWLSWVFAWLDTGKRRYAVYSLVYLAPYLRSNLSLSPEDSWLPIASIVFCIVHIQLEASIKNGDFQGFQLFREISKKLSSVHRETESHLKRHDPKKERNKDYMNLPPAEERSRNEVQGWRIPQKPIQDADRLNENAEDTDDGRNQ